VSVLQPISRRLFQEPCSLFGHLAGSFPHFLHPSPPMFSLFPAFISSKIKTLQKKNGNTSGLPPPHLSTPLSPHLGLHFLSPSPPSSPFPWLPFCFLSDPRSLHSSRSLSSLACCPSTSPPLPLPAPPLPAQVIHVEQKQKKNISSYPPCSSSPSPPLLSFAPPRRFSFPPPPTFYCFFFFFFYFILFYFFFFFFSLG
jgi:hypothetical protein